MQTPQKAATRWDLSCTTLLRGVEAVASLCLARNEEVNANELPDETYTKNALPKVPHRAYHCGMTPLRDCTAASIHWVRRSSVSQSRPSCSACDERRCCHISASVAASSSATRCWPGWVGAVSKRLKGARSDTAERRVATCGDKLCRETLRVLLQRPNVSIGRLELAAQPLPLPCKLGPTDVSAFVQARLAGRRKRRRAYVYVLLAGLGRRRLIRVLPVAQLKPPKCVFSLAGWGGGARGRVRRGRRRDSAASSAATHAGGRIVACSCCRRAYASGSCSLSLTGGGGWEGGKGMRSKVA